MIVPPLASRRIIDRGLSEYFRTHKPAAFNRAIREFCRFYGVKRPKVEWYEYIDWGKTVGKTYENGRIHLIHPENWKRGRIYKTERMWIQILYHEMGHYLFWTDAERKADSFARRMLLGLRSRSPVRPRIVSGGCVLTDRRQASMARSKGGAKKVAGERSRARRARS